MNTFCYFYRVHLRLGLAVQFLPRYIPRYIRSKTSDAHSCVFRVLLSVSIREQKWSKALIKRFVYCEDATMINQDG